METLKVVDIIDYCEKIAGMAQGLAEKALESANATSKDLNAVAWFMELEQLYRYIVPGIIREMAKDK